MLPLAEIVLRKPLAEPYLLELHFLEEEVMSVFQIPALCLALVSRYPRFSLCRLFSSLSTIYHLEKI